MNKNFIFTILIFIVGFLFVGCATKQITKKSYFPPQIDILNKKREIAIIPFMGDKINFSKKLEKQLVNLEINNKPYFKIINRDKINEILKKLNFKSSDLFTEKMVKIGNLVDAKILITGKIKTAIEYNKYRKNLKKCLKWEKKKCLSYKKTHLVCNRSFVIINAEIYTIDVKSGQIIDDYVINRGYKMNNSCETYNSIPTNQAFNILSDLIAKRYLYRVAPHSIFKQIKLMDDVNSVDLNDKQENVFDNSLIYIEHDRLDKAEYLLKKLNEQIGKKSYEIAYDLGVIEEVLGNLEKAQKAYNLADKIILDNEIKPNKLVDEAIKRIKILIQEKDILKREI